jgi:hypothetical protein
MGRNRRADQGGGESNGDVHQDRHADGVDGRLPSTISDVEVGD